MTDRSTPTSSSSLRRTTWRAIAGVLLGASLVVGAGIAALARPGQAESVASGTMAARGARQAEPTPGIAPFVDALAARADATPVEAAAGLGVVDRLTDRDLPADPPPLACPATGRAAVADKTAQRFWLCRDGAAIVEPRPMTTGPLDYGLPPVGIYRVFTKLERNRSETGELLERFVAFYRTPRNNRIAFHQYVNQDPATLGDPDMRVSAGCFRVSAEDSWLVWDFLQVGDLVYVISP